jgi:RNA polymerase sigma-70 factor (ECF subfamily)
LIRKSAPDRHSVDVWATTGTPDEAPPVVLPERDDQDERDGRGVPGAAVAPRAAAAITAAPSFDEVDREHVTFVWQVLRRLGVAPAEVQDACQEVFLTVHRRLHAFEHRSSMRTWLYAIAVRCAHAQRRRGRSSEAPSSDADEPAVEATQSDSIARRQARAQLDEILDELDDAKRAVFVLYELEDLTMAEVAAAVGCPLQTAYSRLQAARSTVEAAVKRRRAREGTP